MSNDVPMRSRKDRIRYAIFLEVTLMTMLIPLGAMFFDLGLGEIGLLGVILSTKAMILSVFYNWAFDRVDAHFGRVASERKFWGRILHSVGFETSLLITSLPLYVWWLKLSVLEAIVLDMGVTGFVVFYTYIYTYGYDKLFPVLRGNAPTTTGCSEPVCGGRISNYSGST